MSKRMNVLIACEESQRVCIEFRKLGHRAFSCDIMECSGGHPEWHIQGDVLPLLNGRTNFLTMDGKEHLILGKWGMIIAHPPCTRLCSSGQRWLYWGDQAYRDKKLREQAAAIAFFMAIANADCAKIIIENPVGIMSRLFRKLDCIYNPYDFEGETECKKTCLWIKGEQPLKGTRKVPLPKEMRTQGIWKAQFDGKQLGWNDPRTARLRSVTPLGVAKAMAEQYGGQVDE